MRTLLTLVVATLLIVGCRGTPSEEEPIVPIRNMFQQPRYNAQAAASFYADGRAMRPLPTGVVAREMEPDLVVQTGWDDAQDSWALKIPDTVVDQHGGMPALLGRGQERYDIYCAPCHGLTGAGDGMVPTRAGGPIQPPTLHTDAMRQMPDGQLYATIGNGIRNMPAYAHAVPLADRWAIVGYVRALQLSQAQPPQAMNLVGGSR